MSCDYDGHGYKLVGANDYFRFNCTTCGECCRNVKGSVMVESLDLYNLARFFKIEMSEVILQYMDTVFLSRGFPIFMLKTKKPRDYCIFLEKSRCKVHKFKPRTCRLYPLGAGPDDSGLGTWLNFIVSQKQHHFTGHSHRVANWVNKNLKVNDIAFVSAEYDNTAELAKLINNINPQNDDRIIELMLLYKYILYDTTEDFMPQYHSNMKQLKQQLKSLNKKQEP